MKTFKIPFNSSNGPGIFGTRLKKGLESRGWEYHNSPEVNIVFASGQYLCNKLNILRLDNLYFDSKNTIGNTDQLNSKIKAAYFKFDKIIFQSDFAKKQYFSQFGGIDKAHRIIYNGVPRSFSSTGPKKSYPFKKTFICSADWRAHKRLEAIIEAFKCFPTEKNVGLVVLGNCKNRVQHKNILYPGKVHHTELPKYIRGADAGVHISWLDCSPNVVYEMLACGLPILCSHNGGTKEIVKNDGITLKLESEYKFNRVDLYNPPKPEIDLVYWGMQEILEKPQVTGRDDLYMRCVVDEYTKFITE
jgi:glycosyltransferase involved in cell wall biosynthesis